MTASGAVAVVSGEPGAVEPVTADPTTQNVTVVSPFQVLWAGVVHFAGETLELPADVATRYTAAGWVQPTE